jgi:hypothetical protein
MSVLAVLANLLGPSAFTAQDEYQRQPLYYGTRQHTHSSRLVDEALKIEWLCCFYGAAAAEGHAVVAQYMVARGGLDMVGHADKDNLRASAAAPTELKALLQQVQTQRDTACKVQGTTNNTWWGAMVCGQMERWLEVEGEAKTKDDQISKVP